MNLLTIPYSPEGKGLPPQSIRMRVPGWGGSHEKKMQNGSEPQPWHCQPFIDAATYGLELVYPYETECHVINDNGVLRFEWDYASEPGMKLDGQSFGAFDTTPAKFYLFQSSVDIEAPPGYVMQTQPHPRFFTDQTGTAPVAMIGHVQCEWWPRMAFVVFKAPPPGQRHIFRKGEPYVQLLFVPKELKLDPVPMPAEHAARRRVLRHKIAATASYISTNVWHEPGGGEMRNYYKRLSRAFDEGGHAAVEETVRQALARRDEAIPDGKNAEEYLQLATQYQREGKRVEAKDIYTSLLLQNPRNAEAASRLGILAASMGLVPFARKSLEQAIAIDPRQPAYRANLGEVLRRNGHLPEAEASLRAALALSPHDPNIATALALTLAATNRSDEALELCRAIIQGGSRHPIVFLRTGQIFAGRGQTSQARDCFQTVLSIDPANEQARQHLAALASTTNELTP